MAVEPDRETIYTAALLACGLPPKPRDYYTRGANGQVSSATTIIDYPEAHAGWILQAEHIVFTGLRDWINSQHRGSFGRRELRMKERQNFRNWIAVQQLREKENWDG